MSQLFFSKTIVRGDTWERKINITGVNSSTVDLTGWKFWVTLKSDLSKEDADADLQFTSTAGDNANDNPERGIVWIHIPASDTSLVTPGRYYYDFQVAESDTPSTIRTLDIGQVMVIEDVTRST